MNDEGRQTGRARLAFVAILLGSCLFAGLVGARAIRNLPISFDGGFNAQAARTLIEKGRYATTYRRLNDFDLRVQTGPAVVVPVAIAFRDLGVNSTTAQLPNLVYLVLLFALVVTYANHHAGPWAALLAALLLIGVPRLFELGLGVLGEVPAVVFFLAGLLCLDVVTERRWTVAALAAGGFLALAVSTKVMMLMAVAVVVPVAAFDRFTSRRVANCHWFAMAAGFLLALVPFEVVRLRALGTSGFLQWWSFLLRRSISQGASIGFPDATVGVDKSVRHFAVLAHHLGSPEWLVAIVLLGPFLLLAGALWHDRRVPHDGRRLSLSLFVMGGSTAVLVGWWLTMSPTGHTWLRRVLAGLILLSLFSAVVIVTVGRRVAASTFARTTPADRRLVRAGVEIGSVLLMCWLWLAWNGQAGVRTVTTPSPEREWTDVMVAAINRLPSDAVIYAQRWYEAPTLSALTGRGFHDLDQFPLAQFRTPLSDTYFVADYHMVRNQPDLVDDLLARASVELVQEVGQCFLYRLDRLEPYPPIPVPADLAELPTAYPSGPENGPFVGGLGTTERTRHLARAVSGFLLRRDTADCLELSVWVGVRPPHTKVLQVRVDDRPVLTTPVAENQPFRHVLRLPVAAASRPMSSLVELWLYRWGPPDPHQLWFNDLGVLTVKRVGFVPCSDAPDTVPTGGEASHTSEAGPRP